MNAWQFTAPMLALAAAIQSVSAESSSRQAAPQDNEVWRSRLEATNRIRAQANPANVRVVFLGDSITREWPRGLWQENFGKFGALNLGLAGDRIESLLWRLENNQWGAGSEALKPNVAVVLIGTNNLGPSSRPEDQVSGIRAIIQFIQDRSPHTIVLTLGILPRRSSDARTSQLIAATNSLLSAQANGTTVVYANVGESFASCEPEVCAAFYRDDVHLSEDGYKAFAEALEPIVSRLMNPP